MICPHCLKTVDDDATFCPHCHGYVGSGDQHREFVFCEGCGARLSANDRTCPKCGRPAPGILSTDSSSSDLAAGKTASFPRLTKHAIQAEAPFSSAPSAAQVVDDAVDPASTNVLSREDLDGRSDSIDDPYHIPHRSYKGLVVVLLLLVFVGGSVWFVATDPMGVMPGLYDSFKRAASEAFPSREGTQNPTPSTPTEDDTGADKGKQPDAEEPLSDDEIFARLDTAYDQIVAYGSEDSFGEVVNAFNTYYLASQRDERQKASASAYSLRDAVQGTINDLDALGAVKDTIYSQDIAHVRQLAQWMYGRVDQICKSWDVSLSFEDGTSISAHQDEILRPMREAGTSDLQNYDAHLREYQPQQK